MMQELGIFLRRAFSINRANKSTSQIIQSVSCKPVSQQKDIKKSLTVAMVGNSNAGKSTLINAMMGLNICAASRKQYTTLEYQRVFYVHGDTQIILLDTPGVLSLKEKSKFNFKDSADVFMIKQIKSADVVAVLIDVSCRYTGSSLGGSLRRFLITLPSRTELVLILNKVDLIKDKSQLLKILDKFFNKSCHKKEGAAGVKFSRAFLISALQNDGVKAVVDYLCSIAQETQTKVSSKKLSDHPDTKLVEQRVKAALLQHLREEVPYTCSCHVEYMHENSIGEIYVVVIVKCPTMRHQKMVRGTNDNQINVMRDECEKDFEKVFGKAVYLRLETMLDKNKPSR